MQVRGEADKTDVGIEIIDILLGGGGGVLPCFLGNGVVGNVVARYFEGHRIRGEGDVFSGVGVEIREFDLRDRVLAFYPGDEDELFAERTPQGVGTQGGRSLEFRVVAFDLRRERGLRHADLGDVARSAHFEVEGGGFPGVYFRFGQVGLQGELSHTAAEVVRSSFAGKRTDFYLDRLAGHGVLRCPGDFIAPIVVLARTDLYQHAERKGGDRLSAFLLGDEQYLVVRDDVVEFVFVVAALVGFVFRKVVFGIDLCPEGIEFRDLRDGEPADIHAVVQLVGNGDGFSDIGAGVGYFGNQVDVLLRRGGRVGHLPDALLAFDGFPHFDGNALGLVFLAFGFDHRRFDVQSAFAFGLHQVGDGGLLFGAPFAIDIARYHAPHELRTAQHDEILESRAGELILIQRQRSGDFDHQVFVHGHFLFGNGDRNGLLAILPLCRESHPQDHDGQQGKDPSTGGGGQVQRWEKCFVDIHSGMWKMCKDDRLPVFGRMNDGSFGLVPL